MTDLVIPLTHVAQLLGVSPERARRIVLRAGPGLSEVRGRQRFASLGWLRKELEVRAQRAQTGSGQ